MNPAIRFRSPLAEALDEFVAGKRRQGYDYTDQALTLSYFDRERHQYCDGLIDRKRCSARTKLIQIFT